ncbi:5431_t:CDS:2 [Gigaspora margarita]|uniref:5431_t:CDS:1 n=1 Tax=Gigaspora margarita TaxID=4874 RepID=A0ABM8W115_GIGMA|nr:5431_t:CDS:2 [Gigaspora margarita]
MTSETPQVDPTSQVEPTPQAKPTTLHRNLMRNREKASVPLPPSESRFRKSAKLARKVLNTYYVPDESENKPPRNVAHNPNIVISNSAGCKLASFRKVLISIRSSMTSETPQVDPTSQVEPTPQAKPTTLHRNLMRNREKASVPLPPSESRFRKSAKLARKVLNTYYVPDESENKPPRNVARGLEEYTK